MNITPVFVLNWNGASMTEKCLDHLAKQTWSDLQVVVMDNGSSAEDVSRLRRLEQMYPGMDFFYNEENLGFTHAHLLMYADWMKKHPDTKYILLINNDAFAEPDWAEKMITRADAGGDVLSSVMVTDHDPEVIDNVGHFMLNTGEILPLRAGRLLGDDLPLNNRGACAGAALYRVSMLKKIGFFDPHFDTGYEDAELGVRAWITGYDTIVVADALVRHVGSYSINKIKGQSHLNRVQSDIVFTTMKLLPNSILVGLFPFWLLRYVLVVLINLLAGRWSLVKSLFHGLHDALVLQRKTWQRSRSALFSHQKRIATWRILQGMDFFLWTDIQRLLRLLGMIK